MSILLYSTLFYSPFPLLFYAATAGSTITNWSNEDAVDSICPLGWQLPRNSGTNSFSTLFDSTLSMNVGSGFTRADSGILSEPFAFPRSGYYNWNSTGLNSRSSSGYYWSSPTYSTARSRNQAFYSTVFNPQDGGHKGYGFAVRCVAR
ncbi:hypothetical protein IKG02_01010 [Candidatus Saccharibacteria bacterium]|nr:hypothetical protein [Candidatus Saccharibacteria bacterium]